MMRVYDNWLRCAAAVAVLFLSTAVFAADDAAEAAKPEVESAEAAADNAEAKDDFNAKAGESGETKSTDKPAESNKEVEKPKPTLSPEMTALRDSVRRTLAMQHKQAFNTRLNTATEILAVARAFGCQAEVALNDAGGKRINAITCLCWNYPCAGFDLLGFSGKHIAPRVGYGRQERPGEFLAVLALARVPADYPIRIGDDVRKVADLVEAEKLGCRADDDSSLKLIGLTYYADEPVWKNDLGESWSIERMIEEEMNRPIVSAPEGGLNRLTALGYAVLRRAKQGAPLEGQFQRAQKFTAEFQDYALSLQNSDGSWGPHYLSARSAGTDASSQLRATGRVLEWLAVTLPVENLSDRRVAAAVECVVRLLGSQQYQWNAPSLSTREIVSLSHAVHALAVYDERVFRPFDAEAPAK